MRDDPSFPKWNLWKHELEALKSAFLSSPCVVRDPKRRFHPMAKAQPREMIKMRSSESPYTYTTTKNKRNHPARLELNKYDPVLRKVVMFKETK
jgi:large subunit ribosomal protein L33